MRGDNGGVVFVVSLIVRANRFACAGNVGLVVAGTNFGASKGGYEAVKALGVLELVKQGGGVFVDPNDGQWGLV